MNLTNSVKSNNLIIANLVKALFALPRLNLLSDSLFFFLEKSIRLAIDRVPGLSNLPRVKEDKYYMLRAMLNSGLRAKVSSRFANTIVRNAILSDLRLRQEERFRKTFEYDPPGFLTISPNKACNLRCYSCYANSATEADRLDYSVFNRIVSDIKSLWGGRFVVISGGEPLMYKSDGKTVIDLFEEHKDSLFLMYTNGLLIKSEIVKKMAQLSNITPAISIEGLRETTDQRRGDGVFDRILMVMDRLRNERIPFGISVTATRRNSEEIVSDEFIDFFFKKMGAAYGWIFHYMPIGRDVDPDLIPTPDQRVHMWERTWEIIREKKYMYADFWNHGTVSDGCISAGRSGGYFYIDWSGNVYPCVFFPYAVTNIYTIYQNGGNLNSLIDLPMFKAIRNWQTTYIQRQGDWLRPCIIRDHYHKARDLIIEHQPMPGDEGAATLLGDRTYFEKMLTYDDSLKEVTSIIWQNKYLNGRR